MGVACGSMGFMDVGRWIVACGLVDYGMWVDDGGLLIHGLLGVLV